MIEGVRMSVFSVKRKYRDSKPSKSKKTFLKEGKTMDMTIYITDLGAYNQGYLIGEHISLPMDEDDLKSKIDEILSIGAKACGNTENEEIFITDYDCDFMEIGEYDDPYKLNEIAKKMEQMNDHFKKMTKFLLSNNLVSNLNQAIEEAENVIIHENSTMEDIAYEFVNECYDIDSLAPIIANAIDYQKIGAELQMDGRYFEVDGDIYEYLG